VKRLARILIVDDDKMTRVALEAMLRNEPTLAGLDVTVTTAEDGHAGLAVLAEAPPDIAIVDLLMPRLDGFATCKALRAHPRGMSIDLCVISGVYRDAAIEKRVESELGAKFFGKPDGLRDLIRHVGEVLHRRRSAELKAATPRTKPKSTPGSLRAEAAPAASVEHVRSGDLAFRSLAAILLDLHEGGATGRLTLRRGRVVKTIDLAEGNAVGAASSTRDETLGHFLVGAGIITDDQHKQAVQRAVERGEKFGEALVEMKMITPARLAEMLTAQVRHKLVSALRWPQGAWRFAPGAIDDSRDGLRLRMVDLVLTGMHETTTAESVAATLERIGEAPIELTERGKQLAGDIRRVFGARVPDIIAQGGTVDALESAELPREVLHAAIDALAACDALTTRIPALGPGAHGDFRGGESTQAFIDRRLEGTVPESARVLYEQLFEDGSGMTPMPEGEAPVDLEDDADSGVIDIGAAHLDEGTRARQSLLKEYLRVQGLDPYGVLMVDHKASASEIAAALIERQTRFSQDYYARFNLVNDIAKLDAIHSAYEGARTILLDDSKRASLDRELTGTDLGDGGPSLDAELAYRAAEDLLARRNYPAAIARLQAAVSAAPHEADYHAALGWAHWHAGGGDTKGADLARPHLNQALAVNPDHAAAHEYKGRIDATLGTDDVEALFHLERALALDPARAEALAAAEDVYLRRGEAWPLVRLMRKLLHHLRGRGAIEVQLWTRVAAILRDHLDDPAAARTALGHARKLAPADPAIAAAIAALDRSSGGTSDPWSESVGRWKKDLAAAAPGVELLHWASAAGRADATYLAASSLVALGHEDPDAETLYNRYRPRFVVRAHRALPGEMWSLVRHPDDNPEIGTLMELTAPVAHVMMPMTGDDLEIDDSMRVEDADLPDGFRKLRGYLANLLGITEPVVYVRTDFGRMLHVGALDEPVLLAGDDALANPERAELAFRLARAMTFLWPGRAVGGSRPARVLKAITLALLAEAAPSAAESIGDDDGMIGRARDGLDALSMEARAQARNLVLRLVSRSPHLNLSRWARALSRTADRVGLLVCGDLPAARRYAADGGATDDDLVEFALSSEHLRLRSELGLSIDV
jgi:DNA-binding response OmpR family regulator/tetratricopeptide (TPR) repeat protein